MLISFWHERQSGLMHWIAGDYPEVGLVAFYGDANIKIRDSIPARPGQSGAVMCPLGMAALEVASTPCTEAADRWALDKEQKVLTIDYSVSKLGPRFPQDIPFRYRVYLYEH
jgi:hypothetical protein